MNLLRIFITICILFPLPGWSSETVGTPGKAVIRDQPYYLNGFLNVPIVDSSDQLGLFQDALFQYDSQIDGWKLLKVNIHPIRKGIITKVETIITDTFPVQVFLKISSEDIACNELGKIRTQFDSIDWRPVDGPPPTFNIVVDFIPPLPDTTCLTVVIPYEKIIPLNVYGLPAGIYGYTVNGDEFSGSFELTTDNVLLSTPTLR
ncbi:MAG: hypothetical protein IPJ05_01410 [Nitrosomonas sp.]|nr:hypothetical protein [Nitrosomonas sp.]